MRTENDALADIGVMVRRVLAARIRDRHLIEDLTQETLVRLAQTDDRLSADARRAYAVVTARNLLASHFRGQAVRGRHLPRLVEHTGADDPLQLTLDKEETAALTSALEQLDPGERDLLVRHEVSGTKLADLADEANVSSGAIAMRLARARANLRLEFLLVFRRLSLPTEHCRPVLLALAVGDRRRQAQLDADRHILTCPTCAELVGPMTQRDRRIAGWLILPAAEALRRAWRALRTHPVQVASVALVVGSSAGLLIVAEARDGNDAVPASVAAPVSVTSTRTGAPTSTTPAVTVPPPTTAPAPSAPAAAPASPPPVQSAAVPAPPAPADTTTASTACPSPAPLEEIDLSAALGCPFAASFVTITTASPGGFEATTRAGDVASIDVVGAVDLPIALTPGVTVSVVGTITGAPPDGLTLEVAAGDVHVAG